ncbi:hypothetical protein, conserved [Trypanosoma brucei gambiense DAL972]|uniref:Uncharacterized protein n=1 Tax=Trypanosoma brucei gambiense (strain MHOM/CI/86/DAL972) TaxID=679716 RepID=D0A8Z0_TRYB9|nr:hypothetical protein, conserved [Trypanosoma brucei gambiense DAL972]CBH18141.1 hypothetical protein, conserved [Trypanosoma brucei gambiense DAL972]|eukprot:XP_011780405.1 hypothetical protein, conserved [Trypanosoma brucei gambiense DAL972]
MCMDTYRPNVSVCFRFRISIFISFRCCRILCVCPVFPLFLYCFQLSHCYYYCYSYCYYHFYLTLIWTYLLRLRSLGRSRTSFPLFRFQRAGYLLPSTITVCMMSTESLECCECSLPVGNEGKMRAVLLVPCQHVLHAGCSEFIRKRRRIQQRLSACGDGFDAEPEACAPVEPSDGRLVACPACLCPIQRLVPLFLNSSNTPGVGDTSGYGGAGNIRHDGDEGDVIGQDISQRVVGDGRSGDTMLQFKQVFYRQQAFIEKMSELCKQRENVAQLTRSCAMLHARRTDLESEIERLSSIIPNVMASANTPRLNGDKPPVEHMTATELELYITQSSAELSNLERELRDQRSATEKKIKKAKELQTKYRRMRATVLADVKKDSYVGIHCEESERKTPVEEGSLLLTCSSDVENEVVRYSERPHALSAPASDTEEAVMRKHALIISSGSSCCSTSDVEEVKHVERGAEEISLDDGDGDDDVIIIDDSPQPRSSRLTRGSWGRVGSEYNRGRGSAGQQGLANDRAELLDEDDVMWHPQAQRTRPMFSQTASTPRASQFLPRRVDRLFQSSLEGFR